MNAQELYADPNPLAPHYSKFDVAGRILLSGHSHQAWPDVAFEGQKRAWLDAAQHVDDKWAFANERADAVRVGYARLVGAAAREIALAENTHELIVRLLSALPLRDRPRLVTTDGEFHSVRRQLARLEEEGIEVVRVPVDPIDSLTSRLAAEVDDRTAAAFVSSVLFRSARIVPALDVAQRACDERGAALVVDAYHHVNVVPFSLASMGLENAFVVGGGYKYCQLGEGNGWMRVPSWAREMRPAITGWFAEFGSVVLGEDDDVAAAVSAAPDAAGSRRDSGVHYADGPTRWAGATYDPSAHYRAAPVFEFFLQHGLTPEVLREVSQHQVGVLVEAFDALDADPAVIRDTSVPLESIGGFLALRSPRAGELKAALRERNVFADFREDVLRLGPAPYLSDRQLRDGIAELGEVVRKP